MKRLLFILAAVTLAFVCFNPKPQPVSAITSTMVAGDTALAAAGSFKIYPLFTLGGAHMQAPQWVTADNGVAQAQRGYIYTSLSAIRVNIYGPATDTSGFTIPAAASLTSIPTCDSISVLNTGGTATTVTWGLYK